MIVTTVVSLKGGVGKTSMVLGLAGAAQASGRKALVVDLDPQANASLVLGADRADFTSNDVLADGRSGVLIDAIQQSSWGPGVDVVPAELALEHRNGDGPGIETALARSMEGLAGYDIVLIDSPPTLGALAVAALAAGQRALIVVEPTLFALVGAEKMLDAIKVVRRNYNKRLKIAGIVVNKVRHTTEHQFRREELDAAYPELVWAPAVPDRAIAYQAQGAFLPVQAWRTPAAVELSDIFADFLERLLKPIRSSSPDREA
ncbi:MAG: chromosome partitioning protein [Frankiales bacterium]|jgi:cellulose biosynthesis protein BcsQ|nr:chromosome partitioning protein [Frankiales bacterium]MDX6208068.1 chromosome partitioning protein [Frankiales bacterium]MDX6213905.1 chromosome partitioning protein [Frankiales bacterium]MDX6223439.1 chromosome partitioning protein [Frankiales bacterium]